MIYILALIISASLSTGQALWGSAVKSIAGSSSNIGNVQLVLEMLKTYKFWLGAALYLLSTVVYFILLSKAKFFSVQLTMTGVAIIVSVLTSYFFFHEHITLLNLLGVLFVIGGIVLVTS